jgi:hypothetical protein
VGFFVLAVLGPLIMFTPLLERTQRKGSDEYGQLANRYVFAFEDKWIQGGDPKTSELMGSPDIQSLADLTNAYSNMRQIRLVPFGLDHIGGLAAITAAPLLPLLLMIFSVPELMKLLMKILFK